jgi:WD40 repeat protein
VAAASPDGVLVASGGYDRAVVVWEARSGRIVRRIEVHKGLVNGLDWSPDGRWLATASSDRTARILAPVTGVERARLVGHTDDVSAVRFSPDGRLVATASFDGTVRIFTRDGVCVRAFAHHASDVNGVCWLPGGTALAAASDDETVSVFSRETGTVLHRLRGHSDWVDAVAAHPGGAWLASASADGTACVWDLHTGALRARLGAATSVVKDVAWSRDGRSLAVSSYDGCVRVHRTGEWTLAATYRAEGLWSRTVAWARDGWLTGSFGGGPVVLGPSGVRTYGARHTFGLNGFARAPHGGCVVACCDDGSLYTIDLAARRVVRAAVAHDAAVLCADFSPDGERLATGSWDRTVRLWDVRARREIARVPDLGEPVHTVCFGEGGRALWIGTFGGKVLRWSLSYERRGEVRLPAHACAPAVADASEALAPPVLVGSHHGSVKQVRAVDSTAVTVGRDGHARIWPDGAAFRAGSSIVNGVALSRAADRIATVSRRDGIQVFDAGGARVAEFHGHACSAKCVAWGADDRTIAAGYYDGHVALWDTHRVDARVVPVCDASLSQVAFAGRHVLASSWDARGSLHVMTSAGDVVGVIPVAGDPEGAQAHGGGPPRRLRSAAPSREPVSAGERTAETPERSREVPEVEVQR